jgi:hydroxyethylthiazole kinase
MSRVNSRLSNHHARSTARLLSRLRADGPLIQCLTNAVVVNFTANTLLAIGAAPAMVDIPTEAGPFARVASGVLVNLGTPHREQREAMIEAVSAANAAGTPWVLDPVAVGSLPVRTQLARELVALRPTVIRGNPSEIIALAGSGSGGRGVDSTDSSDDALAAGRRLAVSCGAIVAISGETDIITDGSAEVRVGNGTEMLTRITGGGCALGAVIAAFASLGEDRLQSTVAACAVYAIAAEQAATTATGPGSFSVAFLDRLANITEQDILSGAVIS